ncbi:PQQ-dependent sugar dehydrogenase [Terriglobus roseus]|uniref:Glucose/arabinose dehydrogenase, beta-propeller fold n=1 Tax=Terriglobus roseus TaxID=392734 RepID=A0A1H4JYF5_9BACT|nr:PQQ-dependent sugar dehydrogenase [Terriglobus roseus]SEB51056.1 Glucose/arabinose dehydrogenase, beta-propeller fold [Terriglobus roseus]
MAVTGNSFGKRCAMVPTLVIAGCLSVLVLTSASRAVGQTVKTHEAAFETWSDEKPGNRVLLTYADIPAPHPEESVARFPAIVARNGAVPIAKPGYKVTLYAEGDFKQPRLVRTAPNGDLFVVDVAAKTIVVLRGVGPDGKAAQRAVFADTGMDRAFGLSFWPAKNPKYVYVGNISSVVRFPYTPGQMKASGPAEVIVKDLPGAGGHFTRDVVFSKDDSRMFVSVGSGSNVDDPDTHPGEFHRADVLEYKPDGTFVKVFASGIRNCVGEAINPITGDLWCSVNERDQLGNHLVPDYITSVKEGGFYGWPWFYMGGPSGGIQDPRHAGKHPELQSKVITPDVLMQPHNGSLQMTFYDGKAMPGVATGDIFAAEHGSWNREPRTGYEVAHIPMKNGKPTTGEYEDFVTGFVNSEGGVWGRPVGITTAKDGALIIVDDGSNIVWRVAYTGK